MTGSEYRLSTALVQMAHLVERVFTEVARDYGLTRQQIELLCVLSQGPQGMTGLSEILGLGRSGLTGLVDRVERQGLVTRTRETCDRRAYQVSLTDKGERLGLEAHERVSDRLDALGDALPPGDRERIAPLLAALASGEIAPA
ncbi:MarR family winged helix-turn-helix transcriptional regulator [Actinomadura sp. 21ATH]|uniref:MarR family winged helix-turn-helix transcriptional regulator n=1 Tax=Actinomadura sp. 21ATH TaxID=1735444 RepID=UPI0035C226F2